MFIVYNKDIRIASKFYQPKSLYHKIFSKQYGFPETYNVLFFRVLRGGPGRSNSTTDSENKGKQMELHKLMIVLEGPK